MTKQTTEQKRIKILGKEFQVSYPQEQEESLLRAALLLDDKMSEIQANSKFCSGEKIAIMAALNLANDLLLVKSEQASRNENLNEKLNDLQNKLDNALIAQKMPSN